MSSKAVFCVQKLSCRCTVVEPRHLFFYKVIYQIEQIFIGESRAEDIDVEIVAQKIRQLLVVFLWAKLNQFQSQICALSEMEYELAQRVVTLRDF